MIHWLEPLLRRCRSGDAAVELPAKKRKKESKQGTARAVRCTISGPTMQLVFQTTLHTHKYLCTNHYAYTTVHHIMAPTALMSNVATAHRLYAAGEYPTLHPRISAPHKQRQGLRPTLERNTLLSSQPTAKELPQHTPCPHAQCPPDQARHYA